MCMLLLYVSVVWYCCMLRLYVTVVCYCCMVLLYVTVVCYCCMVLSYGTAVYTVVCYCCVLLLYVPVVCFLDLSLPNQLSELSSSPRQHRIATSVAILAEISLRSPRFLVIFIIKNVFLGSKYPKNNLILKKASLIATPQCSWCAAPHRVVVQSPQSLQLTMVSCVSP